MFYGFTSVLTVCNLTWMVDLWCVLHLNVSKGLETHKVVWNSQVGMTSAWMLCDLNDDTRRHYAYKNIVHTLNTDGSHGDHLLYVWARKQKMYWGVAILVYEEQQLSLDNWVIENYCIPQGHYLLWHYYLRSCINFQYFNGPLSIIS